MPKPDITPEVVKRNVTVLQAQKIERAVNKIKYSIPTTFREQTFIDKVKDLIAYLLTEEATDEWIDVLTDYVPWGLGWLVGKFLDSLLPEKLLSVIFVVLDKLATD